MDKLLPKFPVKVTEDKGDNWFPDMSILCSWLLWLLRETSTVFVVFIILWYFLSLHSIDHSELNKSFSQIQHSQFVPLKHVSSLNDPSNNHCTASDGFYRTKHKCGSLVH